MLFGKSYSDQLQAAIAQFPVLTARSVQSPLVRLVLPDSLPPTAPCTVPIDAPTAPCTVPIDVPTAPIVVYSKVVIPKKDNEKSEIENDALYVSVKKEKWREKGEVKKSKKK